MSAETYCEHGYRVGNCTTRPVNCPHSPMYEAPAFVVHPDVVRVAVVVIDAIEAAADKAIAQQRGYHLLGTIHLCIDSRPIASISWLDDQDAWCLTQAADAGLAGAQ